MTSPNRLLMPYNYRPPRATLTSLPVEVRLKIFRYMARDAEIKAVGYHDGQSDVFRYKERGFCPAPVMRVCKQFHAEMHEVYFAELSVTVNGLFPSAFTGDMSRFMNENFRNSIREITISDAFENTRAQMGTAFRNAKVQYNSKGASALRKNGYFEQMARIT